MNTLLLLSRHLAVVWLLLATVAASPGAARGASVPAGFQDTLVASGISAPAVLAFAPDGRLFIGEKATGKIRIVKNGLLLTTPFLTLSDYMPLGTYFDSYFERGLLGITFDPAFTSNQLLYVYYTICKVPGGNCQLAKNRIARFRANGDLVDTSSHTVLLDDIPSDAGNHNGGWLGFGPTDGRLYSSTGDGGATSTSAQDLSSLSGKVLRINPDGTIPADNPFVGQLGRRAEIWAYGFRNPWRCRFRSDGRLFCADVGNATWEEINVVYKANNYGWPTTEGPFTLASFPQLTPPIYSYNHNGLQAAITGGDFGSATTFPGDYQQSYFFADFALGWISRALLDSTGTAIQSVQQLATGIGGNNITDLIAGPDGSLYYTNYTDGTIRKITVVSGNSSPIAVASATPQQGTPPLTVQFSSAGSSDPDGNPITFSWDFGDGSATSTAANPSHTYTTAGPYTATLTVSDGQSVPGPGIATVAITVGNPPVITISQPTDGSIFQAGTTINLAGSATDLDQGTLPSSALHWKITLHHDEHVHPYIDDLPGSPQSFTTANIGEASPDIAYEIALSATDATGITASKSVVIVPQTATFTLATNPPGMAVTLDGQTVATPTNITGVVGFKRTLGAPSLQSIGATQYIFTGWSDGGTQTHTITTQAGAVTYTANFAVLPTPTPVPTATLTSTPVLRTPTPTPTAPPGTDITALAAIIARVTAPTGAGSRNLEVIRDGDSPPVGSTDTTREYDTYDGANTAPEDWIGYTFPTPQTFLQVVFQEGVHFWDGGWFDALGLQVRQGGVWTKVAGLTVTPAYPGSNPGPSYDTFILDFPAVSGDGIRLDGVPGGASDFISVGELRVYAAPVTPSPSPTATVTATATLTPISTVTRTPTATATPAATPTQTVTRTPTATPTAAITATMTAAATVAATTTATPVATAIPAASDLTALGAIVARVTAPTGSGSRNIEIIRDGDMPPVGTSDPSRQYDTYDGNNTSPDDWIGYVYTAPLVFSQIVFQEGMHFSDGGWFDTIGIQVRQAGAWVDLPVTITPAYPGAVVGPSYETYVFDFAPVTGDGIRVYGGPGGSADFISVGELRVFGSTPSPTPAPTASATPVSGCAPVAGMSQTNPPGDFFRQVASDNGVTNADRQRVRNAAPITICAVTASFFRYNNVATSGLFHFEIWSDRTTGCPGGAPYCPDVQLGGDSSQVDAKTLPGGTTPAVAADRTLAWAANQPQPSGNFWIVMQSDSLTTDEVAWTAYGPQGSPDPTKYQDTTFDAWKMNVDKSTDFTFAVDSQTAALPTIAATPQPSQTVTPVATLAPLATVTAVPSTTTTPQPSRTATPTLLPSVTPTPTVIPTASDLTAQGTIVARVTAPTGIGNKNPEVIRDGDFPPAGTTDAAREYDTYDGSNAASEDWIGYTFASARTFQRVVFQEGMHFGDGGWFDTLTVEVRRNGTWGAVSGLTITPVYGGPGAPTYQIYTLDFAPTTGDGIRIDGAPGGSSDFISVGELRIYGFTLNDVTALGSPIARVTAPTGTGNKILQVIRDGDVPPVGTTDSTRQYDTYDGNNIASEDWIGYTYAGSHTFRSVMFQEGLEFSDGGWFTAVTVQVRQAGVWVPVTGLSVVPAYPGGPNGAGFESYALDFTPTTGDGIRIDGAPGGSAYFISVGELRIYE